MKAEDLLQGYTSGKRDFSWADLSGVNLADMDLAGIHLYGANLSQAVLVRVNLHGATLQKANLTGADLTGANLKSANLRRANLMAATLEAANLEGAILTGATAPDGQPFPTVLLPPEEPEPMEPEAPLASPLSNALAPKQVGTWTEFRAHLPWATLVFSAIGFSLFGGLLLLHQATIVSWWAVWAIALLGTVSESTTWLVPLLPALVVVMASKSLALQSESIAGYTTLWQFLMVGMVAVGMFCGFKFVLGLTWQRSFQDVLVVSGVGLSATQLFVWTLSGSGLLALLLVLAIGCTGLGAIAWIQMEAAGFSRWQIRWTVAIVTALGLLAAPLVGFAATLQ